jgi:hypothetical protein
MPLELRLEAIYLADG